MGTEGASAVPEGVTDDFWAFLLSVDNPVVMDPAKLGKVALAFVVSTIACVLRFAAVWSRLCEANDLDQHMALIGADFSELTASAQCPASVAPSVQHLCLT
jgi:hypothetical protein